MITPSAAWTAAAAIYKVPIFALEIDTYHYVFSNAALIGGAPATVKPWMAQDPPIDDLQILVNDLDGGADLADLIVHVQDRGQGITADFPSFVFEGKKAVLKTGWGFFDPVLQQNVAAIGYGDFLTLFTGKIDSVESENSNEQYCFTIPDIRTELQQAIFTTGDDGFPVGSNHPRTLNGHPIDLALAAMAEAGISSPNIDTAKFAAYKTLYSGWQMEFKLTSAPTAKDFIENEIMKVLGGYLWTNNLGQITANFFYPLSVTPVFAFTPDNLLDIPSAGQTDLIDQVTVRLDASDNDFLSENTKQYAPAVSKYGLFGQQIIESKGLRSGLNGIFQGTITAFLIFLRYGNKALCHGDSGKNSASDPINAFWSACLLEPGDIVTMTHPDVPDRVSGTMGITDKTYIAMDRNWQFFLGNVQLKLIEVDLSKFKQYLITPNGEADYTAASSADKAKYLFMCGDDDKYSNGDPANTLC